MLSYAKSIIRKFHKSYLPFTIKILIGKTTRKQEEVRGLLQSTIGIVAIFNFPTCNVYIIQMSIWISIVRLRWSGFSCVTYYPFFYLKQGTNNLRSRNQVQSKHKLKQFGKWAYTKRFIDFSRQFVLVTLSKL